MYDPGVTKLSDAQITALLLAGLLGAAVLAVLLGRPQPTTLAPVGTQPVLPGNLPLLPVPGSGRLLPGGQGVWLAGAAPAFAPLTSYQNAEDWTIQRDPRTARITSISIHRDASVSATR